MKTPSVLLSSAACATALFLCAATVDSPATAVGSPAMATPATTATYVGRPTVWSVSRDGSVAFQLEGETGSGSEPFKLWFTTPASQTATTRFEDLVLEALLRLPADAVLTVVSDVGDEDGRERDDAMEIERIESSR